MPYKKDGVAFDYVEAQNHRTVWVGRDLKVHAVPTLCHGQGPLPPARLPPAPSRLALEIVCSVLRLKCHTHHAQQVQS